MFPLRGLAPENLPHRGRMKIQFPVGSSWAGGLCHVGSWGETEAQCVISRYSIRDWKEGLRQKGGQGQKSGTEAVQVWAPDYFSVRTLLPRPYFVFSAPSLPFHLYFSLLPDSWRLPSPASASFEIHSGLPLWYDSAHEGISERCCCDPSLLLNSLFCFQSPAV